MWSCTAQTRTGLLFHHLWDNTAGNVTQKCLCAELTRVLCQMQGASSCLLTSVEPSRGWTKIHDITKCLHAFPKGVVVKNCPQISSFDTGKRLFKRWWGHLESCLWEQRVTWHTSEQLCWMKGSSPWCDTAGLRWWMVTAGYQGPKRTRIWVVTGTGQQDSTHGCAKSKARG